VGLRESEGAVFRLLGVKRYIGFKIAEVDRCNRARTAGPSTTAVFWTASGRDDSRL